MPNPTHPRRSWFAVWRWKRWVWIAVIVAFPVVYLLTVSPATYCVVRWGALKNPVIANAVSYGILPANRLAEWSKLYYQVIDTEWYVMCMWFGDVPATGMTAL